jgi:hypothetical protein
METPRRNFYRWSLGLLWLGIIFSPSFGFSEILSIKSGLNQTTYKVEIREGTAGKVGVHYILGEYFSGGNESLKHGFSNRYGYRLGFCPESDSNCFISRPSDENEIGALEATDHNWLQATKTPIIVDLGSANESDRIIVFSSLDHFGVTNKIYEDLDQQLWNVLVEAIEFTVYGSHDFPDALETARTEGVFGNRSSATQLALGAIATQY